MSLPDLLTAIAGGGGISLILTDAAGNVVGTLDATVTQTRRRQMTEAIDGQQGLRGDSRDLQASSTVSICFQNPRVGARKNMALWSHATIGLHVFDEKRSGGCCRGHFVNRHHFYFEKTENDADSRNEPSVRTPGDLGSTVNPVSYTHLTLPTTPYV